MSNKKFFHELSQKEIDNLIADKKRWSDIMNEYKQPKWCSYPEALNGKMGCWALVDLRPTRQVVNETSCQSCVRYVSNVC